MPLIVSDLIQMPHLRLETAAGSAGIGGRVTWAHASDLDTPWQWMTGGELLMKNGRTLPRSAAAQVRFLERLADTKVSGLVIGLDPQTPALTNAARQAADDRQLPILHAPYSVGFAAIGRAVADANMQDEGRRLAVTERVYNIVRKAVAQPAGQDGLRLLSRDLACHLAVLDAETGDVALEHTRPLPHGIRAGLLDDIAAHHGSLPGVLHLDADGHRGLAVQVPDEEPTVLVAYDFRGATPDIGLLQHVATAVAVLLAQQGMRLEHDRRTGGELLAHLLDTRLDEASGATELAKRGLDPVNSLLVAATHGTAVGQEQLHLGLWRRGISNLLLRRSATMYALVPASDTALEVIRRRLGDEALIGVSDPVGTPGRLPTAQREATWASRTAAATRGNTAHYAEATLLSVLRDTEEANAVVDRTLGRLLDYDAAHQSDLAHTLDTYLSCQRSWQQSAAALGIHRQTVIYRIRRVEQITGRHLGQTADIAELWLALRARDLVAGNP